MRGLRSPHPLPLSRRERGDSGRRPRSRAGGQNDLLRHDDQPLGEGVVQEGGPRRWRLPEKILHFPEHRLERNRGLGRERQLKLLKLDHKRPEHFDDVHDKGRKGDIHQMWIR